MRFTDNRDPVPDGFRQIADGFRQPATAAGLNANRYGEDREFRDPRAPVHVQQCLISGHTQRHLIHHPRELRRGRVGHFVHNGPECFRDRQSGAGRTDHQVNGIRKLLQQRDPVAIQFPTKNTPGQRDPGEPRRAQARPR